VNFVAESVRAIISRHQVSQSVMSNQLRLILMMFYAPARATGALRDHAALRSALLWALLTQSALSLYSQWPHLAVPFLWRVVLALLGTAITLLFVALVFVPLIIFTANLFERRASFALALQQEYTPLASALFYAWATAGLIALPLAVFARVSGYEATAFEAMNQLTQLQRSLQSTATLSPAQAQQLTAQMIGYIWQASPMLILSPLPFFLLWATIAVRQVFASTWLRAIVILLVGGVLTILFTFLLLSVFGRLLASPFILLMLFFLLRNYFGEIMSTQRARASFKQNLEAATLNPADASAHYNLALIHQQRGELEAARERFQKAVDIDADETDAHYQLGRIARAQNKWPEAIEHFSKVVESDDAHAQHEIWREIGATYLAAGQYEDARDALEKFLARRTSDPEGLYLMGRAHAGLGHQREAKSAMQACIEAVKSAPAYKYRAEKRWLNEALAFLRSQA